MNSRSRESRSREGDANIALLIDADNASPVHLDEVLLVLGELGTINIRRAYGNWSKASLKGWSDLALEHSLIPIQQLDPTKGKSVTDMKMAIDAMDLLHGGRVDHFGIMSSDSDFLPLVQRIQEDGLKVYGFGTTKTPRSFKQACTRFFDVSALAHDSERSPGNTEKPGEGQRAVDSELLELLGAAYKASKRDEEGYAALSELGQRAKAVSSFAVRNYGFTRFSDLVRGLPNFEVKTGADGRLSVKRLR